MDGVSKNKSKLIMESCVDSMKDAIAAEAAGAHRIELCSRLDLDGLSPNVETVKASLNRLKIPIKVMVRVEAGAFYCTKRVQLEMVKELVELRRLGIKEVVLGCLDREGKVDVEAMQLLNQAAEGMAITFHKAIDLCPDIVDAMHQLRPFNNVRSILSSGGAATALAGQEMLRKMQAEAKGRFTIIPAGKITHQNLNQVHSAIGSNEYHGRKIVKI